MKQYYVHLKVGGGRGLPVFGMALAVPLVWNTFTIERQELSKYQCTGHRSSESPRCTGAEAVTVPGLISKVHRYRSSESPRVIFKVHKYRSRESPRYIGTEAVRAHSVLFNTHGYRSSKSPWGDISCAQVQKQWESMGGDIPGAQVQEV